MNTPRPKGQKRPRNRTERKLEDYTRYSPPKMRVSGAPNRLLSALFDTKSIFEEGWCRRMRIATTTEPQVRGEVICTRHEHSNNHCHMWSSIGS